MTDTGGIGGCHRTARPAAPSGRPRLRRVQRDRHRTTQGDRPSGDPRLFGPRGHRGGRLYPTVKDALPELADEIDHDREEHAEAKQLLGDLQGMDPSHDEFDTTFRQLISDIRHHVEEEENDLFPKVRDALTEQELRDLGEAMAELQSKVPTRPHPRAPQEPPANTALGPIVGALDRLRDGIRERVGKRDV